jgi:hypothetical protein
MIFRKDPTEYGSEHQGTYFRTESLIQTNPAREVASFNSMLTLPQEARLT